MTERLALTLHVNGAAANTEAAFTDTLLTVLRDRLQSHGRQARLQSRCVRSMHRRHRRHADARLPEPGAQLHECAHHAHSKGRANDPTMRALQDTFEAMGAMQCGFCTPGMLIAARALLDAHPRPSIDDVRTALSGNLCRCTGYRKIVDAVRAAAGVLRGEP